MALPPIWKGLPCMKTAKILACFLTLLILEVPLWGCSVEPNSQTASSRELQSDDLTRYKHHFEDCVIGNVLAGSSMENSKKSCLTRTQKSCELDLSDPKEIDPASLSQRCLKLVSNANENVLQNGLNVECDSGYCTITF